MSFAAPKSQFRSASASSVPIRQQHQRQQGDTAYGRDYTYGNGAPLRPNQQASSYPQQQQQHQYGEFGQTRGGGVPTSFGGGATRLGSGRPTRDGANAAERSFSHAQPPQRTRAGSATAHNNPIAGAWGRGGGGGGIGAANNGTAAMAMGRGVGANVTRGRPTARRSSSASAVAGRRRSSVGAASSLHLYEKPLPEPVNNTPFHNELLMALRRRGGYWGLRGLRILLGRQLRRYQGDRAAALAASAAASANPQSNARGAHVRGGGGGSPPPPHLRHSPPNAESIPITPYFLDALAEYQRLGPTLGVGWSGGHGGGGGSVGGSSAVLPQQALTSAAYCLYWLGPETVRRTCSIGLRGGGGRGSSNITDNTLGVKVEQPESPIIVVNAPDDGGGATARYADPYTYGRDAQPLQQPRRILGRNGSGTHANATDGGSSSDAAFADRCFVDVEALMRLLGCWLPPARLRAVQGCHSILAERFSRRKGQGSDLGFAGGGRGSGGRGSGLGIKVPGLVAATTDGARAPLPTLEDLMSCVNITRHPDCLEGRARADNALARFFYLWGLVAPPPTPSCAARRMGGGLNMDVAVGPVGQFGNGAFVGVGSGTRSGGLHASVPFSSAMAGGRRSAASSSVFTGLGSLDGVAAAGGGGGGVRGDSSAARLFSGGATTFDRADAYSTTAAAATPITLELFCQFHADFVVSFSDSEFAAMIPSLWGEVVTTEALSAVPAPPPPLNRAAADALFDQVDNNKNGILSLAEIDAAIVTRFPQFNYKPLIMRAYKLADADRSGHISRREFHRFLVFIAHLKHFSDLFQRIDTDRSRSLSYEELVAGKEALGLADAPPSRLRAIFAAIDGNRQGKILFDEFAEALLTQYPPPELGR